jgi:hypothetical protein
MQENGKKNTEISARISTMLDFLAITPNLFAKQLGYERSQTLYDVINGKSAPSYDFFRRFGLSEYSETINVSWLLTGKGNMTNKTELEKERKKIPVFDVESIGGVNEHIANMEGVSTPSEWIDAGDWFMNATAAIHHYGDSMVEYPSGCILALREVFDWDLIVWGKNYVIETDEYRITKRLQRGDSADSIMAYSTNPEIYSDGKLIHEPVLIPKKSIRRLAIVLGYVVKEQSSGMIYNVRNKK